MITLLLAFSAAVDRTAGRIRLTGNLLKPPAFVGRKLLSRASDRPLFLVGFLHRALQKTLLLAPSSSDGGTASRVLREEVRVRRPRSESAPAR
jgi:hypothetical protein